MVKTNPVNVLVNALGLVSLVVLMQKCEATQFIVGGSKGWSVPSDSSPVFNQWAEKMRFQIGDSLVFKYQASSDSVLQVTKQDFDNCNTNSPIAKFNDGNTEFKLKKSGPYYFISGNKDNCNKNEKLVVIVMANRTTKNSPPPPSTNAPPPGPTTTTTTSDQQPPVASPPSDDGSTLAPSAESNPPKSGATSYVMSVLGSLGAFMGYSLFLAF